MGLDLRGAGRGGTQEHPGVVRPSIPRLPLPWGLTRELGGFLVELLCIPLPPEGLSQPSLPKPSLQGPQAAN